MKNRLSPRSAALVATALFAALTAEAGLAQPTPPPAPTPPIAPPSPSPASNKGLALAPGEGRDVAEKLAKMLAENFVTLEQGAAYAARLRERLAAGAYDSGTRQQLADRVNADLMAVARDGHLALHVTEPDMPGTLPGGRKTPPPIQAAKWLKPGIAYIRFSLWPGSDETVAAVRRFMADHASAKAMIFDLRNHRGGGLDEMDVIFSYLFRQRTHLVTMEVRRPIYEMRPEPPRPTLIADKGPELVRQAHYAVPGKATPLQQAKVILLVSNRTGSAAEHFSLAMKSSGRGLLIGEATAGANHFGGEPPVTDHFSAFIPVGRTFDPKTGRDWEGDGVAPDVVADPRQALVEALKRLGVSEAEAKAIDAGEVPAEPVHRERRRAR